MVDLLGLFGWRRAGNPPRGFAREREDDAAPGRLGGRLGNLLNIPTIPGLSGKPGAQAAPSAKTDSRADAKPDASPDAPPLARAAGGNPALRSREARLTTMLHGASRAGYLAAARALQDPAARRATSGAVQSARTALVPSLVDGWFEASAGLDAGASGRKGGNAAAGSLAGRVAPPADGSDCPVCIVGPQ